ncbi:MAG TPA: hypothetical protein VFT53_04135 [Candidatus Saccharimonadales bacterium]|nr:hypothetical protein [Candidatus Saccharimonadales bacterium]
MTEILPPYAGLTEECPKSECIELPAAMLAAAPSPDDPLYSAYMTGAHAAIKRRQHPVAQPDRYAPVLAMPSSDSDLRYGPIGIEEMPYLSAPVVEMIREEMPDMVMAADRGGRILGLSVYGVWQASYPSVPFPTIDSKLHFGRVSKRIDNDAVRNVIRHTLSSSGVTAEMAQRAAEGDARPLKVSFWTTG